MLPGSATPAALPITLLEGADGSNIHLKVIFCV
jgi:hypothetical protein